MATGMNRRAVLDQLGGDPLSPLQQGLANNSGVRSPSLQPPSDAAAPLVPPPIAAPAPAPAADYSSQLEGFNSDKLAANKNDPKYRFASIAKGFNVSDPTGRQGLSDALAADTSGFFKGGLNGDILQALDPETGQFGGVDVIRGLDAGGQGWQWGAGVDNPQAAAGAQAVGQPSVNPGLAMAQNGLAQQLQGSPYGNIQNALGRVPQPNLQALIDQLSGGQ